MSHEAKLVNINTCKHQLKTFILSLAFQIRENYLRVFFFLSAFPFIDNMTEILFLCS